MVCINRATWDGVEIAALIISSDVHWLCCWSDFISVGKKSCSEHFKASHLFVFHILHEESQTRKNLVAKKFNENLVESKLLPGGKKM